MFLKIDFWLGYINNSIISYIHFLIGANTNAPFHRQRKQDSIAKGSASVVLGISRLRRSAKRNTLRTEAFAGRSHVARTRRTTQKIGSHTCTWHLPINRNLNGTRSIIAARPAAPDDARSRSHLRGHRNPTVRKRSFIAVFPQFGEEAKKRG